MSKRLKVCIKQSKAYHLAITQSSANNCSMVWVRQDSTSYLKKVCAATTTLLNQLGSRCKKYKISIEKDNEDDNIDDEDYFKVVEEKEEEMIKVVEEKEEENNNDNDYDTDDKESFLLEPSVVIFSSLATKYYVVTIKWLKELGNYKL